MEECQRDIRLEGKKEKAWGEMYRLCNGLFKI